MGAQADTSKPRGPGDLMALGWVSKKAGPEGVRIWQRPDNGHWVGQEVALGLARGEIPVVREEAPDEAIATVPVTDEQVELRKLWRPGMPLPGKAQHGEDVDDEEEEEDEGALFW